MKDGPDIKVHGIPASPYTRKVVALLRYRRIPYQLMAGNNDTLPTHFPQPKVNLLPIVYLDYGDGQIESLVDSSPIIRRLESEFSSRPVSPSDPVLEFLELLLEDYADEWLTRALFHYRWHHDHDADRASHIVPLEINPCLDEQSHDQRKRAFYQRQTTRLHVVGSSATTSDVIESSYTRFLQAFNQTLEMHRFILGEIPCAADFAIYGQLTQLACFDPTPTALTLEIAPRVVAWVRYMEDLSGLEYDPALWGRSEDILASLKPLLTEVGASYVPVMLANAQAFDKRQEVFEAEVYSKQWQQQTFSYHRHCLASIQQAYAQLCVSHKKQIDRALATTDCCLLWRQ